MPLTLADLQARGFDAEAYIEATRTFIAEPTWANYLAMQNLQPNRWEEYDDCPGCQGDDEVDYSDVEDDLEDMFLPHIPNSAVMAALEDRRLRMLAEPRPIHDPHATPPIPAGPGTTAPLPGDTDSRPMYSARPEPTPPPAPPEPTPIDYQPTLDAAAEAMRNVSDSDPCWVVTFGPHRGLRVPFGWSWAMLIYGGDVVLNVDGMDYRALHPQAMVAIGAGDTPDRSLRNIVDQGLHGTARQAVPQATPAYDDPPEDDDEEEEEPEPVNYRHYFDCNVGFVVYSTDRDAGNVSREEMYNAFIETVNDMGSYDVSGNSNHYDTEEDDA